ncbi:MAG: hypothetical protein DWQ02_18305 [Bacteroidetes bacterium]|nr:MAG: hypothetical protein DWQ02_18305 [Bacteroidota bacterium]
MGRAEAEVEEVLKNGITKVLTLPRLWGKKNETFLKRNNMKLKIIFYLLVFQLVQNHLPGQSLQELQALALEYNFGIKSLKQEYASSLERIGQVSDLPDPEVNAGFFVLPPETRLGPQRVVLGASQMLPWKGTIPAREALVSSKASENLHRIDKEQLKVLYNVKVAYLKLYELIKTKEIIKEKIPLYKTLESLTLVKTESGKAVLSDVLLVQLKIRELEQQLKIIDNQKAKSMAAINSTIGRPVNTEIRIDSSFLKAEPFASKSAITNSVSENHPSIKLLQSQQETAQRSIDLNVLNGKPSIGVGLDYILVGKRDDLFPENNGRDILIPKVKMKIPLYRKKYTAKTQEEQLKIAALEHKTADVQLEFSALIEQAFTDFEDAELKIELYEEQKKLLESIIEIQTEKYSQSGNNFEELLRLENDLLAYDLKLLKAIVQSHLAQARIESLML